MMMRDARLSPKLRFGVMISRSIAASLACLPLSACINAPPVGFSAPAPKFDALAFFDGQTKGVGRLRKLFSAGEATIVDGKGVLTGKTLVLDQTVQAGAKSPTHRQWRLLEAGPGRYTGTLSGAPVRGEEAATSCTCPSS